MLDLEEVSDRGLDLLWKVSAGHHLRVAEKYVRGEAMVLSVEAYSIMRVAIGEPR